MKRDLLEKLVAARQQNQPVVLVRGLNSNSQFIVTPKTTYGDTDTIDPTLKIAAQEALHKDGTHTIETEKDTYLIQTLAASPRIIIIGAVHIAQALIPMAKTAGYDIILIDPRTAFANPQRIPQIDIDNRWPHEAFKEIELDIRTAVVTLSHDPKIDEPALCAAMDSNAFYIGALGSKGNHKKRLERLSELGYDKQQLKRINGPIGLPLGGRSPAEIAVATLAQIIQARHRAAK